MIAAVFRNGHCVVWALPEAGLPLTGDKPVIRHEWMLGQE